MLTLPPSLGTPISFTPLSARAAAPVLNTVTIAPTPIALTNAQLLTLFTNPVSIIPAPGVNRAIQLLGAWCRVKVTGAYVNGFSSHLMYAGSATFLTTQIVTPNIAPSDNYITLTSLISTAAIPVIEATNTALILQGDTGNEAGGNAANFARFLIAYVIVDTTGF